MTENVEVNSELIKHEQNEIINLYKESDGMKVVLDQLSVIAKDFIVDVDTKKGRELITSQAYKVSRSKTMLEKVGASITSEWKAKSAKVDLEKNKIKTFCDKLRDEIKAPLVKWENEEKEKLEALKRNLNKLTEKCATLTASSSPDDIISSLSDYRTVDTTESVWGEMHYDAFRKVQEIIAYLEKTLPLAEKRIKDEKELKRLKDIEAENEKIIKRNKELEDAEKERKQKEIDDKNKIESDKQGKIDSKENEKKEAQRKLDEAKEREDKLKQQVKDQEVKAKQDQDRAVEQEKERVRLEDEKKKADEKKISNNKEIKKLVHRKMLNHLLSIDINEETAKKVITEIAKGKIENLAVNYQDQEIIKEVLNS